VPLDLFIAGPGFEVRRRLAHGEPALVLGRDADCAVCLPDPLRNISRRHLSVWNERDVLHFLVLSVVNGVQVDGTEIAPAARGLLVPGQALALADYRLAVTVVPEAPSAAADPWAQFEQEAAQLVAAAPAAAPPEDDPFGDWGFQSTFGPGTPGGPLQAAALVPADDLGPFFAGLGLAGAHEARLTRGELEAIGRLTRRALQGLLQAVPVAQAGRQASGTLNPLRAATPLESKLHYLFGGQAAAAGCLPPERAVGELVDELLALRAKRHSGEPPPG
jgi:predicted component of type VI protein secretion system